MCVHLKTARRVRAGQEPVVMKFLLMTGDGGRQCLVTGEVWLDSPQSTSSQAIRSVLPATTQSSFINRILPTNYFRILCKDSFVKGLISNISDWLSTYWWICISRSGVLWWEMSTETAPGSSKPSRSRHQSLFIDFKRRYIEPWRRPRDSLVVSCNWCLKWRSR